MNLENGIYTATLEASLTKGIEVYSNLYTKVVRETDASLKVYYPTITYVGSIPIDASIRNTETRVGTFSGNFGYYGDNGQLIAADNVSIVNEENNTVFNPVTGETSNVTNWTYDYSDRSYHLTVDSGDTITVTYGDKNVTIKEGDTVYNVYYIIGDDSGGGEHTHRYSSTVTTAPTCTIPGVRTYTCSCGESYTEAVPATGHTWVVRETVTTQYDENGSMIQEGYTIYKCSVCGEEYKSTSGTAPPDGGGGGSGGGSDGVFSGIFGILWDFCSFFFGFFTEFVAGGIKGFLDAMLDGASGFFDILNPVGWFDGG